MASPTSTVPSVFASPASSALSTPSRVQVDPLIFAHAEVVAVDFEDTAATSRFDDYSWGAAALPVSNANVSAAPVTFDGEQGEQTSDD